MKQRRDITLGEMQDEQLYAIALEKRKNGNGTV